MSAFSKNITLRFEDADPAGIVFYPRAIALAHGAVEDLISQTRLGWSGWFDNRNLAAPVRHVEAEFFAPMRAGETIAARVWVKNLGQTSATFVTEFSSIDGALSARFCAVHVLVDRETGRPVTLPPEIREALSPFSQ